jgi:hypothetical protein
MATNHKSTPLSLKKFGRVKCANLLLPDDIKARIEGKRIVISLPLNGMNRRTKSGKKNHNRLISSTYGCSDTKIRYKGNVVKVLCTAYYEDSSK